MRRYKRHKIPFVDKKEAEAWRKTKKRGNWGILRFTIVGISPLILDRMRWARLKEMYKWCETGKEI